MVNNSPKLNISSSSAPRLQTRSGKNVKGKEQLYGTVGSATIRTPRTSVPAYGRREGAVTAGRRNSANTANPHTTRCTWRAALGEGPRSRR